MSHSRQTTLYPSGSEPNEADRQGPLDHGLRTPEEQRDKEQKFKRENAEAFASMNAWVEKHGLPLAKHRQF